MIHKTQDFITRKKYYYLIALYCYKHLKISPLLITTWKGNCDAYQTILSWVPHIVIKKLDTLSRYKYVLIDVFDNFISI